MANHVSLFAYFTFFYVLFAHYGKIANCATANTLLCAKTPYPELCNSLITTIPQTHSDGNFTDLQETSLRETLSHARIAHELISQMNRNSAFTMLGKLAWADCLELYEDSTYEVNRSIGILREGSFFDVQTWLSAAIANGQACEEGFRVFNLSQQLQSFPLITSNFSMFLSNSLSINKNVAWASLALNKTQRRLSESDDQYPEWVSNDDRELLRSPRALERANIVVAQDGSGQFKTINKALAHAAKVRSDRPTKRFVIYIKKGLYKENVVIEKSMKKLMFIGDGIGATIISGNRSVKDGFTTFKSATVAVKGDHFMARGITFENTAGSHKGQAVALRSSSDLSVFHRCSFRGYQDTLYVHSHRQFYRDCEIYGTVDFIFGDATCVFQRCKIFIRKVPHHTNYPITAQSRSDPDESTGIVIRESVITSEDGRQKRWDSSYRGYLGRPWRKYARTAIIECEIDGVIDPAGWLRWDEDAVETVEYYEYMNTGIGSLTTWRVKWPGFHVIKRPEVAERFSVRAFLGGDSRFNIAP